jgi:hypothetical protein
MEDLLPSIAVVAILAISAVIALAPRRGSRTGGRRRHRDRAAAAHSGTGASHSDFDHGAAGDCSDGGGGGD